MGENRGESVRIFYTVLGAIARGGHQRSPAKCYAPDAVLGRNGKAGGDIALHHGIESAYVA